MTDDLPIDSLKNLERAQRMHIALILDRSGSMSDSRNATIEGFNGYLARVRSFVSEAGIPATGSLTVFANDVEVQQFMKPLDEVQPLTPESYEPWGLTALLDAIGVTVSRLEEATGAATGQSFLVCVVSDGYENNSTYYAATDIARTISRLTETGNWTFTYLAANQDLDRVSDDLHIPRGNVASYAATPDGTDEAWERHAAATVRSMDMVHEDSPSSRTFYEATSADRAR
jgi:hypothetical protein